MIRRIAAIVGLLVALAATGIIAVAIWPEQAGEGATTTSTGGLIAVYTQALISAGSTAPTIGASGAIAGVLGAYALLFPRARVLTLIFIIFFVTLVEIPALILLAVWFILQFVPALGQVAVSSGGDQGVAYFAHVGGFVFGLAVAAIMLRTMRGRRPEPRLPVY